MHSNFDEAVSTAPVWREPWRMKSWNDEEYSRFRWTSYNNFLKKMHLYRLTAPTTPRSSAESSFDAATPSPSS